MKRQKERARQEKQREKLERKRQRKLESKNQPGEQDLETLQPADSIPSVPGPDGTVNE